MPHLREAKLRHAKHFETVLQLAGELYALGGDSLLRGLEIFDVSWSDIQFGWRGAEHHAKEDAIAASLCLKYPTHHGAHILRIRQPVDERIKWLIAAMNIARSQNHREYEAAAVGNLGAAFTEIGDAENSIKYQQR